MTRYLATCRANLRSRATGEVVRKDVLVHYAVSVQGRLIQPLCQSGQSARSDPVCTEYGA